MQAQRAPSVSPYSVPCLVAVPLALVLLIVAQSISAPGTFSMRSSAYEATSVPGTLARPPIDPSAISTRSFTAEERTAALAGAMLEMPLSQPRPTPQPVPAPEAPTTGTAAAAASTVAGAIASAGAALSSAVGGGGSGGGSSAGSTRVACEGPLCSVGKVAPYRAGDLEAEGELEKAVRARSHSGELVITYANEAGSPWVTNLVLSLRDAGIEHFLVIMMTKRGCDGLFDSPSQLSCGWSSWDLDGCKSESDRVGKTERMWFIRHYYLARIIELGGVNVMALDGDMTIQSLPYPMLHDPATLGKHAFILSLDNGPSALMINNGFMYLRGCKVGNQVYRILHEILQRERDVCKRPEVYAKGGAYWSHPDAQGITSGHHKYVFVSAKDQKIYQDVLMSAFCGRHIIIRNEPTQCKIEKWQEYVKYFTGGITNDEMEACARFVAHRNDPADPKSGYSHWTHALRLPARPASGGIVGVDLRGPNPGDPPPAVHVDPASGQESAAAPNSTFISSWHGTMEGEIAGWDGHWAYKPPVVAHFVGGLDKVGAMLALGWWRWETEVLVASLRKDDKQGPVAVGAVEPQMQRHFRAGLPKVLAMAGEGASPAHASYRVSVRAQAARRVWLSVLARLIGRVGVEPVTACTSKWIMRMNNTRFGYSRRRQRYPREGIYQNYDERTGVGAFLGDCAEGFSPPPPHPQGVCCYPMFCKTIRERHGVHGLPGVHHRLVEAKLEEAGATRVDVRWAELGLPPGAELGAEALMAALNTPERAGASVLVLHVPRDMQFPRVTGLGAEVRTELCRDFGERCRKFMPQGNVDDPVPAWPSDWAEALAAPVPGKIDNDTAVAQWLNEHSESDIPAWRQRHWRELPPGEAY